MPTSKILQIVRDFDSWPYLTDDALAYQTHMQNYYYLKVEGYCQPLAYIQLRLAELIPWPQEFWNVDHEKRIINLYGKYTREERTAAMDSTLQKALEGPAAKILGKWNSESYSMLAPDFEQIMGVNGCAVEFFGMQTRSIYMLLYVKSKTDEERKIWVAKRSMFKSSYPGQLDVTIVGKIVAGERPLVAVAREAFEEASIPESYTLQHARSLGVVRYQQKKDNAGKFGCMIQNIYVYEMELSPDIIPTPFDGEVDNFKLVPMKEVRNLLETGKIMPLCAMSFIDNLIHNGDINDENEPQLPEIQSRVHRKHDLFVCPNISSHL
ncbi:hypothetical protein ABW20_dc0100363 [Dactylellina cionopaga]|nr:hypothetical protein ABW20_dc0100363 [Dactylellina cionopaga]